MLHAGTTFPLQDFLMSKEDFPGMKFDQDLKQYEIPFGEESFPFFINNLRELASYWGWAVQEQEV